MIFDTPFRPVDIALQQVSEVLPVIGSGRGQTDLEKRIIFKPICWLGRSRDFPCKATFRQVFIIIYRLEIQSVVFVFLTRFVNCCPLSPSLWLKSPPSTHPCVNTE
jgi:hypothetical protein